MDTGTAHDKKVGNDDCDDNVGTTKIPVLETLLWSGLMKLRCHEEGPSYMQTISFYVEVHLSASSNELEVVYSQDQDVDTSLETLNEVEDENRLVVSCKEIELVSVRIIFLSTHIAPLAILTTTLFSFADATVA